MNTIEEKMYQYSVDKIAEKTGIPKATIYRWKREENIESCINFIHLLNTLNIDPVEYMKTKKGLD